MEGTGEDGTQLLGGAGLTEITETLWLKAEFAETEKMLAQA